MSCDNLDETLEQKILCVTKAIRIFFYLFIYNMLMFVSGETRMGCGNSISFSVFYTFQFAQKTKICYKGQKIVH